MSKHKKQHYIPSSYLKAWCDPDTPEGQTPYVWRFSKDGSQIAKKAPHKIFIETDMYTIYSSDGDRDLHLEYNLSNIESRFSKLRARKLNTKKQLTQLEHLYLCVFVGAMYARTKVFATYLSDQWQKALDISEKLQNVMDKASHEDKKQLSAVLSKPLSKNKDGYTVDEVREFVEHPIQSFLDVSVVEIAPLLFKKAYVILEAPIGNRFITSDNPCVWFDPAIYKKPKPFGAGGLLSPTLEITLPISPFHMVLFGGKLSYSGLYTPISNDLVDNLNKRTRLFSDEFFISNNYKIKLSWL